jgi:hypothetical protein
VSGFKLKNTVLAVKTTLRGDMMNQLYKWYFISAQQDNVV